MILCTKRRSSSENMRANKTRFYGYQTWPTYLLEKFRRCAKICGHFFPLVCDFWMLIGWAGKFRSNCWNTPPPSFCYIMIGHNLHHILYIYKARGLQYLNTFLGDHLFSFSPETSEHFHSFYFHSRDCTSWASHRRPSASRAPIFLQGPYSYRARSEGPYLGPYVDIPCYWGGRCRGLNTSSTYKEWQ